MGTSKTNISQINKYVKGRLNAQDMHQLERETYDDAFLNEAMEGYEELASDDHEETLADLKKQLHKRAAKEKKGSIIMWRLLPIAASVLLLLGAGYWFLKPDPAKNQNIQIKPKDSKSQNTLSKNAAPKTTPTDRKFMTDASIESKNIETPEPVLRQITIEAPPLIKYKTDTVEYIASDYKVRANASVDEMLKKVEGFEVDTNGSITFNGQSVTKARLNGKDYSGGDVSQAIKSLPADIVEKFQIVDDYGDQARKTGIKSGDADKVLVFATSGHDKDTVYYSAVEILTDTTRLPAPRIGWNEYMSYIRSKALNSEGLSGETEVSFFVGLNGQITLLRTIKGSNTLINRKTSAIILKGPKWRGGRKAKEVRLKIFFYKK
nr:hypothetical protein [uncultured Mucilaginibacter sp.]